MTIRVVLFEDNNKFRESLSALIDGDPLLTMAAAYPDATDVINKIADSQPDLVLMDIELPGMNGLEALTRIKIKYPSLPVLIQTVFEDDDVIFEAICNGASGYILKNMEPTLLLGAISETFNGGAPMSSVIAKKVLGLIQSKNNTKYNSEKFNLTAREQEILKLMVGGLSYKMIGAQCNISFETVRSHIRNIYEKLHVITMAEAVAKAVRNNLA